MKKKNKDKNKNKNKNTITVVPPTDKKLESTVEGMLIKFKKLSNSLCK